MWQTLAQTHFSHTKPLEIYLVQYNLENLEENYFILSHSCLWAANRKPGGSLLVHMLFRSKNSPGAWRMYLEYLLHLVMLYPVLPNTSMVCTHWHVPHMLTKKTWRQPPDCHKQLFCLWQLAKQHEKVKKRKKSVWQQEHRVKDKQ